jgi:hypothetical protein
MLSYSKFALIFVLLFTCITRCFYFSNNTQNGYNATSWDALGYYMYLPSTVIYNDVKTLDWLPEIDSTYHVTGGKLYQAIQLENGGYTNKYFCGIALIQSPFFFLAHGYAKVFESKRNNVIPDGFSWPYQYAILFGAIFYLFIGLVFLRKVLLFYFSEKVTALTLVLLVCGTNLLQYAAIDGAMSHVFIFPLYAIIIWVTIKWHESPKIKFALIIGLLSGIATISRPTEAIIIFIPIFWSLHSKVESSAKWLKVKLHKSHVVVAVLGGIIGVLSQFIYWKYTTGSWLFDVGSKWCFLNPWWRVLFGHEQGWFLYTPLAIAMIVGFWFMKNQPFRKSVVFFCFVNIWVVISWSDWHYGASYSTRALIQSYPMFALPLACVITYLMEKRKKVLFVVGVSVFLIILNMYQLQIYNTGIIENFSPFYQWFK